MLKMGKSKPWPEALEKLTGSKVLDVSAITEYFKPLNDWLVKQRQEIGYSPPGWDESPTIPSSRQLGPTAGVPPPITGHFKHAGSSIYDCCIN